MRSFLCYVVINKGWDLFLYILCYYLYTFLPSKSENEISLTLRQIRECLKKKVRLKSVIVSVAGCRAVLCEGLKQPCINWYQSQVT